MEYIPSSLVVLLGVTLHLSLDAGDTLFASYGNNSKTSRTAACPKPALCFCDTQLEFSTLTFWQQMGENFE